MSLDIVSPIMMLNHIMLLGEREVSNLKSYLQGIFHTLSIASVLGSAAIIPGPKPLFSTVSWSLVAKHSSVIVEWLGACSELKSSQVQPFTIQENLLVPGNGYSMRYDPQNLG